MDLTSVKLLILMCYNNVCLYRITLTSYLWGHIQENVHGRHCKWNYTRNWCNVMKLICSILVLSCLIHILCITCALIVLNIFTNWSLLYPRANHFLSGISTFNLVYVCVRVCRQPTACYASDRRGKFCRFSGEIDSIRQVSIVLLMLLNTHENDFSLNCNRKS